MTSKTSRPRTPARRRTLPSPVTPWYEVRQSRIQGRGVFAARDIPTGTRIIEYTGERLTWAESDRRYDDASMNRHHTFLFILNARIVLDGAVRGNDARFINHSCAPNCESEVDRGHIWIEALRDIAAGEELSYDYAYERDGDETAADEALYVCHCGSERCRGTILLPATPERSHEHHAKARRATHVEP